MLLRLCCTCDGKIARKCSGWGDEHQESAVLIGNIFIFQIGRYEIRGKLEWDTRMEKGN
jgi:hypothetical protein